MLGHRGVRLGLTFPQGISRDADTAVPRLQPSAEGRYRGSPARSHGAPGLHCPGTQAGQELGGHNQKSVEEAYGLALKFKFGSMLEVVRACMRAGNLAEEAEFFSFGTNDLTQATFSFSREDAENKFLPMYIMSNILQDNPFESLMSRVLAD